jgi:hypothetical protein
MKSYVLLASAAASTASSLHESKEVNEDEVNELDDGMVLNTNEDDAELSKADSGTSFNMIL